MYSDNNATKTDFNVFAKAMYSFNYRFHFFADIQYRRVGYSFPGYNEMMVRSQQEATHKFINLKAGVAFEPNSKNKIYASVAMGNKEPIRGDYINSTPQSRPRPEQMTDVEAGYRLTEARLRCGLNFYFMHYKDQLILTGQINDVGDYTRMNVPSSYRSGLELEAGFNLLKNLALYCNVTASRNKISSFTEYVDDYNAGGQQSIAHSNTDIAFSPSVIAAGGISWLPVKNFSVDLTTKYVGKQYLDNTGNDARKLDAYFLNDILLQYRFSFSCCKEIALKFAVYNLFDEKYESNGYTYGYIYGGAPVQENFYYPQAGRNWLGGVTVGF